MLNKKLIFNLSLFGLIMAVATISLIPESIEPWFWLIIFIICAYLIAKRAGGKYFLHGFLVSLVNCIWIIIFHVLFVKTYIANHPEWEQMQTHTALDHHKRILMIVSGPIVGIISGIVLGLFSFIASKMVGNKKS